MTTQQQQSVTSRRMHIRCEYCAQVITGIPVIVVDFGVFCDDICRDAAESYYVGHVNIDDSTHRPWRDE